MKLLTSLLLLLILASCATLKKPEKLVMHPVSFTNFAGWQDDQLGEAVPVLLKSCAVWQRQAADKLIGKTPLTGTVGQWQPACTIAQSLQLSDRMAVRHFFEQYFTPYHVTNDGNATGLFTGYYEIDLHGSRTRSERYHEPLYKMPEDKVSNQPYFSRKEINEGALQGRNLELIYVDDAVKAFFLHIQGSGRVTLDDGSMMRVGYAGQNGQSYLAIGRYLLDTGALKKGDVSASTITAWLYSHPDQAKFVMERNPSYVFFKDNSQLTEGPIGAQGVPLTAERSLAVDRRFIPLGVPLWLETEYPTLANTASTPFRKLMIAQDTGGAIKGVVRGDVYFGNGALAEERAGGMKQKGIYYMLLPNTITAILPPNTSAAGK
jgi:membrane-bound lytic murein transglycosylase A